MRRLPKDAGRTRFTYSTWAFPQANYPELLAEYFGFCRDYYKRQRYRANLVHLGHRLHKDASSVLSPSLTGPVITLDPSSTGDEGWEDFVIEFNEFCVQRGGTPLLNQTRSLTQEQTAQAFGTRLKLFNALRRRLDISCISDHATAGVSSTRRRKSSRRSTRSDASSIAITCAERGWSSISDSSPK